MLKKFKTSWMGPSNELLPVPVPVSPPPVMMLASSSSLEKKNGTMVVTVRNPKAANPKLSSKMPPMATKAPRCVNEAILSFTTSFHQLNSALVSLF